MIETARKEKEISTTNQLKEILAKAAKAGQENKFFARVFQALRIEVNDELGSLKDMLIQASGVLAKGGRLVVISYHSLEDRLVKNFMKSGNFEGKIEKDFYGNPQVDFRMITRKPLVPDDDEILRNNRARSAKLRIAEKI
jgi:16S rRNA (cytosine1402-N4)-methyltransferase